MQNINLKKSAIISSTIIIIIFAVVEQFVIDCFLPSFPAIAHTFNVANTHVQLAITLFVLGTTISQFVFGPLADSWGRKPVFILGMLIFLIGTLFSLFAQNIQTFLFGRLIQGFGIGSGYTIARAMARDMFSGKALAKLISYLSIIILILPLASPILGGYIQHHLGWRYIFALLLLLGISLTILISFFLHETLAAKHKQPINIKNITNAYKILLTSKVFISNTLCGSFVISTAIVYITITPFLYQNVLHLSLILFGWVTASTAVSAALSNFLNTQLLRKFNIDTIVNLGVIIVSLGSSIMLFFAAISWINLPLILFPMLIIVFGAMLVGPNLSARAIDPFPQFAGKTAALYGSIQTMIFSIWSAIAAMFHTETQLPLAILLSIITASVITIRYFTNTEN